MSDVTSAADAQAAQVAAMAKPGKAVRPRPAAAIVVIDRGGSVPKVLLGRRNAALAFLPGKYAFPGGRLEPGDQAMAASGTLAAHCLERLAQRRARNCPAPEAFALAGIRELFEETGLLLGTRPQTPITAPIPSTWQAFAAQGFAPNLAPLRFFARAVTPPVFPRRFDTSFFLLDASAIAHQIDGCVSAETELVELVWLPLEEAAKRDIPRITAMILLELQAKIAAGFPEHLPVPFFYERKQRWIREEL